MQMKRFVFALVLFLLTAKPVSAGVSCTTQYGGGQTCVRTGELLVNKKIFDPVSKTFVDNLGQNDHLFTAGEEVTFTIEVKNVGDAPVDNITVTDTLPYFLTWVGGDPLISKISRLEPGQSVTKTIKAKVTGSTNQNVLCKLNRATVDQDSDTAQLCIPGSVPIPPHIPKAGPEHLLLLFPLGAIGFYMRGVKK